MSVYTICLHLIYLNMLMKSKLQSNFQEKATHFYIIDTLKVYKTTFHQTEKLNYNLEGNVMLQQQ